LCTRDRSQASLQPGETARRRHPHSHVHYCASHWEEVARAHGEIFAAIRPAATAVIVAGLLDPAWLVEIEADAVRPG
jgi:enamine deaminase RidA (YjgF/YER057c/UK114 family)